MTVYVDVLLVVNLFMNYALLLSTSLILKSAVSRWRLLLGAGVGSVCGLVIFLPVIPIALDVLMKFAISLLIVFCSFGYCNLRKFIRCFLTFFAVNFAFCGIMYILWTTVAPTGMVFNNGTAYFDIDLKILAISTVVCFAVLSLIAKFTTRKAPQNSIFIATLTNDNISVSLTALADTGNSLRESFSGYPVAIAEYKSVEKILPQSIIDYYKNEESSYENLRLIPHRTVSGTGLLPAFRPDSITIQTLTKKIETDKIYIAVTKENIAQGEFEMIINPSIFEEEKSHDNNIKNQKFSVKT